MESSRTVADDLLEPSTTQSRDEELLLQLFRRSSARDRSETLFRLARLRFAPFFAIDFRRELDARDPSYLHEELEEQLRSMCPREHLGSVFHIFEEPLIFASLWRSAWGDIAPVILGSDESDGQRADELLRAVVDCSYAAGALRRPDFRRADALRLIENWREEVLQRIFSLPPDQAG